MSYMYVGDIFVLLFSVIKKGSEISRILTQAITLEPLTL